MLLYCAVRVAAEGLCVENVAINWDSKVRRTGANLCTGHVNTGSEVHSVVGANACVSSQCLDECSVGKMVGVSTQHSADFGVCGCDSTQVVNEAPAEGASVLGNRCVRFSHANLCEGEIA